MVRFYEEPGFRHTRKEPRYFVLRLGEADAEYFEGYRFEIQFLDSDGSFQRFQARHPFGVTWELRLRVRVTIRVPPKPFKILSACWPDRPGA